MLRNFNKFQHLISVHQTLQLWQFDRVAIAVLFLVESVRFVRVSNAEHQQKRSFLEQRSLDRFTLNSSSWLSVMLFRIADQQFKEQQGHENQNKNEID